LRSSASEAGGAPRGAAASPFRAVADGVRVAVRLAPKAARDRIQGTMREADGATVLKVGVTAVPEAGKANEALVKLLAKTWKLPKTGFTLVSGATDRRKSLHLAGEPAALLARLEAWLETEFGAHHG
jgi:uncharacterized protein (TIGR00251 family)